TSSRGYQVTITIEDREADKDGRVGRDLDAGDGEGAGVEGYLIGYVLAGIEIVGCLSWAAGRARVDRLTQEGAERSKDVESGGRASAGHGGFLPFGNERLLRLLGEGQRRSLGDG